MRLETELKQRSIWEDYPLVLITDYELGEYDKTFKCPHIITNGNKRILPLVIQAINEGNQSSTGVCLLCMGDILREKLPTLRVSAK